MRDKLFGLNKNIVDQLLKKIRSEQQEELDDIEKQVKSISEENRQYRSELASVLHQKHEDTHSKEVINLAEFRLQNVIQYLDKQKTTEMFHLREKHEQYIANLHQRMKDLDRELQRVNKAFQNMSANLWNPITDHYLPSQTYKNRNSPESSIKSELVHEQPLPSFGKQEDFESQPITKKTIQSNFWGLDEKLVEQAKSSLHSTNETVVHPALTINELPEDFSCEIEEDTKESGELSLSKSNEYPKPSSKQLVDEVDSLKSQYMLGKVAGENIYNKEGQLLIKKNTIITKEIIELAHQQGKLAELIVNMKMLGGEE